MNHEHGEGQGDIRPDISQRDVFLLRTEGVANQVLKGHAVINLRLDSFETGQPETGEPKKLEVGGAK